MLPSPYTEFGNTEIYAQGPFHPGFLEIKSIRRYQQIEISLLSVPQCIITPNITISPSWHVNTTLHVRSRVHALNPGTLKSTRRVPFILFQLIVSYRHETCVRVNIRTNTIRGIVGHMIMHIFEVEKVQRIHLWYIRPARESIRTSRRIKQNYEEF